MKLGEDRWGRGLSNMPDEEALIIIFLLVSKLKDAKMLTQAAAACGVCISVATGVLIQDVFSALENAVKEWDEQTVKERHAILVSMADQLEAGYAEFKERVYKEGVEPYDEH